jgi:hypothetical protein
MIAIKGSCLAGWQAKHPVQRKDFTAPPMNPAFGFRHRGTARSHIIAIRLRELPQLFNLMDPSPFHEKDLDPAAAEYITSWADEYPIRDPIEMNFHIELPPAGTDAQSVIESAVHTYFASRTSDKRLEFRRLMREGQKALVIGLIFLGVCVALVQGLPRSAEPTLREVIRESLLIAGWVAMWRPMQIYLYEWWPIRRRRRLFDKLARAPIEVTTA